jgi:hypothetical protein
LKLEAFTYVRRRFVAGCVNSTKIRLNNTGSNTRDGTYLEINSILAFCGKKNPELYTIHRSTTPIDGVAIRIDVSRLRKAAVIQSEEPEDTLSEGSVSTSTVASASYNVGRLLIAKNESVAKRYDGMAFLVEYATGYWVFG